MKRKVISIIIIGIMVYSVYACGSTASKEVEDALSNGEVQQAADEESAEAIYIIEPELTQNDTYEMPDWLEAYMDYMVGLEYYDPRDRCSFLYVDEDDIPEFVIDTGSYETGCFVLTFYNGEVDVLQTGGLRFRYIEKNNLFCDTAGHAGEYANRVYSIENGKWAYVAGGKYISELENGLHIDRYSFEWEGEKVEEELYWESLNHVFDEEQAIIPRKYTGCNIMLSHIEAGDLVWESEEEQETKEDDDGVITDFEYSDEYIPISKVDFVSYQDELSGEDWQALSSFFPILLEGRTFKATHCPYPDGYTDDFEEYSINDLYESWYPEYPDEFILKEFSLCDLTGDGQKELVLYSDFGIGLYFVFHKEGDDFYAVYMPARWFEFFQKNGIYIGSGGAGTFYFRRLHFLRNVFWEEEIAMYTEGYCEIGGEEVSVAEMETWADKMMVGEAVWYDAKAVKMQDWQMAYLEYMEDYIENYPWQGDIYDLTKYSFIYVDDDDIPELVIYPGVSIGCDILTFHDGEIDVLSTDQTTICYIKKKNLLDNYSGTMGFYHDYIYSIKNGKWVYVTGGEYSDKYNDEHAAFDFTYRWEGEEVAEEAYMTKLNAVFDTEHAIEPENFVSLEEMLSHLQMK